MVELKSGMKFIFVQLYLLGIHLTRLPLPVKQQKHSKGLKLGHLLNCTNTPWSSRPLQNYLLDKL